MERFKWENEFFDSEFRFGAMPDAGTEFGGDAKRGKTFYVRGVDVIAVG